MYATGSTWPLGRLHTRSVAGALTLPVHVHDHPRGAKSALGAVEFGEICLNRVISISLVSDSFHSCDFPSVASKYRHKALKKN